MSQRQIIQVFEQYQKARMQFVQTVADLTARPQNVEILQKAGVMSMLRPLMLDVVPSIQQTAALALGRLADHSDDLAEAVVKEDILPQLINSLASQNVSISNLLLAGYLDILVVSSLRGWTDEAFHLSNITALCLFFNKSVMWVGSSYFAEP
ncbi:hypothetical protein INR49_032923 [Caranx melampygus]|nr:hypothetical protein INR49_032923 [Caranx melampygus]